MKTDANPQNKINEDFSKVQEKQHLDNQELHKNLFSENSFYRFEDRRVNERINSGRRQMDLLNYQYY